MQITARIADLKRIFLIPGESQPGETLYLLLLAFCYAAYFLLATVIFYSPGGVVETEEFWIYVQGWISVPILTLLAVVGVRAFKQRYFQGEDYFYPLFAAISLLTSLICAFSLSLNRNARGSTALSSQLSYFFLVLFPVIQVLSLGAIYKFRRWLAGRARPEHILLLNRSFPFAIAVFLINFCGVFSNVVGYKISIWVVFQCLIAGLVLRVNPFFFNLPNRRRVTLLIDIAAGIVILLSCFDPNLSVQILEDNFFIGPVNALLHGKTMLVDVYSQYGVFLIEFLAAIFKLGNIPLTYHAFTFVNTIGAIAQFGAIYFIMRTIFKSERYAFVGLILVLLVNLFGTTGLFQFLPAIGPFRFGLCYLLVVVILLRLQHPRAHRWLDGLEYALLGLASIWSFETFVYVAAIFGASRVYQSLLNKQNLRSAVLQNLLVLGAALGSILFFQAAQAAYIYLRAGQWPNWGIYLNYLLKYSVDGLGALPVDPWSPWYLLAIIYLIFIVSVGLTWLTTRRVNGSVEIQTLVNMTFMGIAQLTYFVGRSHPNNLLPICIPALVIALYGFQRLSRLHADGFSGFSHSTGFVFYCSLALIAIIFLPKFPPKLPETSFPLVQKIISHPESSLTQINEFIGQEIKLITSYHDPDDQISETVDLIHKYAEQQPRVAVFITPKGTTQAIVMSNKTHLYPISDAIEDSLSAQVVQLVMDTPSGLKVGDTIFLIAEPKQLNINKESTGCLPYAGTPNACIQILQKVVNQICSQFGFDEIEKTPTGVSAMRLVPSGSGTSDYCSKLAAVSGP